MVFVRHRIALIASSFDPYAGGVEQHTRQVAARLVQRGAAVEVWTVDRGEHLGVRHVDGITVRYMPTPLPAASLPNLAHFAAKILPSLRSWLSEFRRFHPDLLHVHCFGPNGVYATALSTVTRAPLVLSSHGETFMDARDVFERSRILRSTLRASLERAAVVTAVSQSVVDDLSYRFGAKNVRVVANGVPEETILERLSAPVQGVATVFCVGRLEHNKGFDLALRALAQLAAPARMVVAGTGTAQHELHRLAHELGLARRVVFPGQLSADAVTKAMRRASVVVMPSRREAFGIVALEAWAAGVPLVATSLGGPRHFVTDGVDGILVDPTDVAALARAIDYLLANPEGARRMAQAGLERVRNFTWDSVVDQYETIYDEVLA